METGKTLIQNPTSERWKATVRKYQQPSLWRATIQIANTLVAYVLLWFLIYLSFSISLWLTLPTMIIAAGLRVRLFIILHDCGHGSFFKSKRANDALGILAGIITFTPYYSWRWEHSIHHATSGHLAKRGTGDLWTMTVQEYLQSPRWRRIAYRLARNPVILFVVAPSYVFLIDHRFPSSAKKGTIERRSVTWTNLTLLSVAAVMSATVGFKSYLLIEFILVSISGAIGIWLFYVQHQFEDAYWEWGNEWDFVNAALMGSSFYKLPKILQWFTGNIGFHHIHHLNPKIPNYNLERCHTELAQTEKITQISLIESFKTVPLRLWDEEKKKMVSFKYIKDL